MCKSSNIKTEIMKAHRFALFLHKVTTSCEFSLLHLDFQYFLHKKTTKNSTWRNDADDGDDGGGAPTTLVPWPSPSLNARREKISRAGKPLTLMNTLRNHIFK